MISLLKTSVAVEVEKCPDRTETHSFNKYALVSVLIFRAACLPYSPMLVSYFSSTTHKHKFSGYSC